MQATEVAKIWPQKDYCQRFEKEYLSGHQSTQWHSNHHTLWLLFNYFKLSFSSYQLSLQSFVVLPLLVVVLQRNFLWLLLLIQLHLQQWGLATAGTTKKLSVTALTNSISTVRAWLWNMENNNFFGIYNHSTHSFSFHPFSGQRAGRNSWATAKCLEFGINNPSIIINLDLKERQIS